MIPPRRGHVGTIWDDEIEDIIKQGEEIMANTDNKAPANLELKLVDEKGKSWGTIIATSKKFSTGSKGFYAGGKVRNPDNTDAIYQVGCNITLIGSKPE